MFWGKKVEKYSLDNFRQLYAKLQSIKEVTPANQAQVIEILRMISELMIWGDQHNPLFFEFFVNKSILAMYVNYIRGSNKEIQVQVIQALGILIANTKSQEVTFYLLSNNYINQLISFPFDFAHTEELTAYYISFLKTLSNKLSLETIDFLFNESTGEFPLFSEALKLASNPDTMVRIAVRTLSLNVFRLDHPPLRKYLTDHAVRPYFTNLALFLVVQFNEMNVALSSMSPDHRTRLDELVERHSDWLHYMQDVLELRVLAFSEILLQSLLDIYLLPVLLPLLSADLKDPSLFASVGLSLFLLAQVFVTFDEALLVNTLAAHLNGVARLLTHPDERVVYYSMALVLSILKCRVVNKLPLQQAGLLSNNPLHFSSTQIIKKEKERRPDRGHTQSLEQKLMIPGASVWDTAFDSTPSSTPRSVNELFNELALTETFVDDTALSTLLAQSSSSEQSDTFVSQEQPINFVSDSQSSDTSSISTATTTTTLSFSRLLSPSLAVSPDGSMQTLESSSPRAVYSGSSISVSTIPELALSSMSSSSQTQPSVHKSTSANDTVSNHTLADLSILLPPTLVTSYYPHLVIDSLLQLLARMDSIQLGTLLLMCEVLRELVMDNAAAPRLHSEHLHQIQAEVKELAEFIKDQLQQEIGFDRVLDFIEDEIILLGRSNVNLTHHKNLLPTPLTEGQLRRSVQQYMCTRKLLRDMIYSVALPLSSSIVKQSSESADPMLSFLRSPPSLSRGSSMDMDKDVKVIPCVCVQDNMNLFLLLHPDLFLLVRKHSDPKLLSQAVVELALPLKHQEAQQSPYNPNILLLKMKSERCPHPSSQRIIVAGAAERERLSWSMSLVFTHQRHCLALVKHLKEARTRTRHDTLKSLLPLLDANT